MTAVETPPTVSATPTPTPASAWPVDEAELLELPSGASALVKRPSLMAMMRRGEIPNPLLNGAVQVMEGRASEDYAATADVLAFMVAAAFVEPRVVYEGEPGPDEISIDQVSDADQAYVLSWINTGVADLRPFRDVGESAAAGGNGSGVRDEAE